MNFLNGRDTHVLMQFYNMNILNLMPLFEDKNKVDHNDFSAAREVLFDTALNAGLGQSEYVSLYGNRNNRKHLSEVLRTKDSPSSKLLCLIYII